MSRLAQAGESSTASPACARCAAACTASGSVAQSASGTPTPCSAARICGASRPISTTARAWRATGAASGEKSCPLPSPPRMTTRRRSAPRPARAATVAPTLVPLLSSKYSTSRTMPMGSTRCGSPRYSRRPYSMGASGQPAACARASAARALVALCRPRMRSASAGMRRCTCSSSSCALERLAVSSASCARTSQAMPLSTSMPKSPGRCGMSAPKVTWARSWGFCSFTRTGGGSMSMTSASSRFRTIRPASPKMRALACA